MSQPTSVFARAQRMTAQAVRLLRSSSEDWSSLSPAATGLLTPAMTRRQDDPARQPTLSPGR